jgi:hypothetical protein
VLQVEEAEVVTPRAETQAQAHAEREASSRTEEQARKKAEREYQLRAQRKKEAEQKAAESSMRRQEEAKRAADRNQAMQVLLSIYGLLKICLVYDAKYVLISIQVTSKITNASVWPRAASLVVQMRIEREAEEYARVMAEHQARVNTGRNTGSATATNAQKKRKKKRKGKSAAAADEPSQPASNQKDETQYEFRNGFTAVDCGYEDAQGGFFREQGDTRSRCSPGDEAIRAAAIANGLGELDDDELQAFIEQQRAIEADCARNHMKKKSQEQQSPPVATVAPTAHPAQSSAHESAAEPSRGAQQTHAQPQAQPPTCPAEPACSAALQYSQSFTLQQQDKVSPPNGARNGTHASHEISHPAAGDQYWDQGSRAACGAAPQPHADSHHASTRIFHETPNGTAQVDVTRGEVDWQLRDQAYYQAAEASHDAESATCPEGWTGAIQGAANAPLLASPELDVLSESAAPFGAFLGGEGVPEHSQPPQHVLSLPLPLPVTASEAAPTYAHNPSLTSMHAGISAGWHSEPTSASMHNQQHSHFVESWHPQQYFPRDQQDVLPDMQPEEQDPQHNNMYGDINDDSIAYARDVRGHEGQYERYQYQNHHHSNSYGYFDDSKDWQPAPPAQWAHEPSHCLEHQYGLMGHNMHNMHGVDVHGYHATQAHESSLWASPPAGLTQVQQPHTGPNVQTSSQPVHVQHQQDVWSSMPPLQSPQHPEASARHQLGHGIRGQSNPSRHGALYQAFTKRNHGVHALHPDMASSRQTVVHHSVVVDVQVLW